MKTKENYENNFYQQNLRNDNNNVNNNNFQNNNFYNISIINLLINAQNSNSKNINENEINNNNYNNLFINNNSILFNLNDFQTLSLIISILNNSSQIKINSSIFTTFIKSKITSNPNFVNFIFYPFFRSNMLLIINNKLGNLIYQNIIEILNDKNFFDFVNFLTSNFYEISHSIIGTRIIQKLIEYFIKIPENENKKIFFLYSNFLLMLKGKVFELSKNENANHIIQKFIKYLKFPLNNFIYEELYENFQKIAINKFGCCVIQKCLNNGTKEQTEKIIYLIINNLFLLINNEFGNYIIQKIILFNKDFINYKIVEMFYNNLYYICNDKYSSNVIEKLLEIENKDLIEKIIRKLTENEKIIMSLISNQYGNYIIQKILIVCYNEKFNEIFNFIINIIHMNLNEILSLAFGKKLISKIINKFPFINNKFHLKKFNFM